MRLKLMSHHMKMLLQCKGQWISVTVDQTIFININIYSEKSTFSDLLTRLILTEH